jgi:hypothetical protein
MIAATRPSLMVNSNTNVAVIEPLLKKSVEDRGGLLLRRGG